MDLSRSGDNPVEGNKLVIDIPDDDSIEVISIDSDSEGSLKLCGQKLPSLTNDEVKYVKTTATMAKPARKQNGLSIASPFRNDKTSPKLAQKQGKFLSPRKRRMSSTVLSSAVKASEPKAVKLASIAANVSRGNGSANALSEKKNVSSKSITGSNSMQNESKQPAYSAAEQFRSHFGLSPSRKTGPRPPSSVDFDSSQSVAESPLSRPSTPPVDWPISDELRALTSLPKNAQATKLDCNVSLLSQHANNKAVTKSGARSSARKGDTAVLPSDLKTSHVANDCGRPKQEDAVQIDAVDDDDSDSSSCIYLEIARSPFRKIHGKSSDDAIYIASSSDDDFEEDEYEEYEANRKRNLSLLYSKNDAYRGNNKVKPFDSQSGSENANENGRRVNLMERKEERRLQAVLAGHHENLCSPSRVFRHELGGSELRVDASRNLQLSESSTDQRVASKSPSAQSSSSTQNAGEPTQQSNSDRPLSKAATSLASSPSSVFVKDFPVSLDEASAVDKTNASETNKSLLTLSLVGTVEHDREITLENGEDKPMPVHGVLPPSNTSDIESTNNEVSSVCKNMEKQESFEVASQPDEAKDCSLKNSSSSVATNNENLHGNTARDLSISAKREKRKAGLKNALKRASTKKISPSTATNIKGRVALDECSVFSDDEDMDLPDCMLSVKHWSRKYVNKTTNLPVWEFTVYGGDDSILYSFRAFAAKSTIPGAGLGAFIEFIGARRLNETSNERRLRILDHVVPCLPKTMRPLQACLEEDGGGISVYLKGENLHGKMNRDYRPKFSKKKLVATFQAQTLQTAKPSVVRSKAETVRLVSNDDLHEILEYEAFFVSESSAVRPIGHLNIHTDCDYDVDKSISEFYTGVNCIDLGRYGPFQPKDRKPEDYFVLKSFIFCQVPVEWGFGAVEKLHGMDQYIDITDDVTGLPSHLAAKEIPMYVNEIGHKMPRKQNVFIKDSWDNRVINYYFMPNAPLKKRVPVELLTNYKSAYEGVRERKGYGRRNVNRETKSDDCIATRLERNFAEREDCELLIESKPLTRLTFLLQKVDSDIFRPLINKVGKSKLSPLQWIAVRRVYWLIDAFRRKVKKDCDSVQDNLLFKFYERKMNSLLHDMDTVFCETFTPFIKAEESPLHSQQEVKDAFYSELLEEVCFDLRFRFPRIMDTSLYCPVAVRLISSFSERFAKLWLFSDSEDIQRENRLDKLYAHAVEAKEEILACINGSGLDLSCLQFSSGLYKKFSLEGVIEENVAVANECGAFSLQNTTLPKGITAAIVEKLENKNNDAIELRDELVMIKYDGVILHSDFKHLGAAPYPSSKVQHADQINTTWYVLTQVVWVVHGFATIFMRDSSYSLAALCEKLDVNISDAEFIVRHGIRVEDGQRFRNFLREIAVPHSEETPEQEVLDKVKSECIPTSFFGVNRPPADLVYEGPPTTKFPGEGDWPDGWTQKTYKRASGNTVGRLDHYWLPTTKGPKLRSTVEVLRYLVDNRKESEQSI